MGLSCHGKRRLCVIHCIKVKNGVMVFFGPTTFHQGRQLLEVVGPDVQQLFLANPLTLDTMRRKN